mmetsp:Transcript_15413/g.13456  ORF Transcript_15413/g.13456 Transcript_15413/m.13456 type:complete len:141 (+) Transcript_15413:229-651(+)
MEREMVNIIPGYLQSTTSQLMKEINLEEEDIDEYNKKRISMEKIKTSKGAKRNDINPKVDLKEFVINNKRLYKKLGDDGKSKSSRVLVSKNSTRTLLQSDIRKGEHHLIFNKSPLSSRALHRAEILQDLGLIYEVLTANK